MLTALQEGDDRLKCLLANIAETARIVKIENPYCFAGAASFQFGQPYPWENMAESVVIEKVLWIFPRRVYDVIDIELDSGIVLESPA